MCQGEIVVVVLVIVRLQAGVYPALDPDVASGLILSAWPHQEGRMKTWKVGELAGRTGLTVRTLHHYDQIGLLTPSQRSRSGHRLYGERDVRRLQKIVSLRQLGLRLDQVAEWLSRPRVSAAYVLDLHIRGLREQIQEQEALCSRLESIARSLKARESVSMEDFLNTIEAIQMYEKYYTPEELERVKKRGEVVGQERIREVEQEWPLLISQVRAEMEKGTDPSDPAVRKLAAKWMSLVEEFTGGDPQIAAKVKQMYQQEPTLRQQTGIDADMMEYVRRACA
jgi:MerR family transcriptional regulator, thiopeptide resistance regulator